MKREDQNDFGKGARASIPFKSDVGGVRGKRGECPRTGNARVAEKI